MVDELTDEELAAIEHTRWKYGYVNVVSVDRLIAALRASRAEVEELIVQANGYAQEAVQLRAEVEQLRRFIRQGMSDPS